jgi:hypothetical protein
MLIASALVTCLLVVMISDAAGSAHLWELPATAVWQSQFGNHSLNCIAGMLSITAAMIELSRPVGNSHSQTVRYLASTSSLELAK